MRRTSPWRGLVLIVACVAAVLGVSIGFWPVSVTVVGGVPYSCGSGFVHSRHTWKVDSRAMAGTHEAGQHARATPNRACPSRIYSHRDAAYALVVVAAAISGALLASAAFDPGATPVSRSRRRPRRSMGGASTRGSPHRV